MTPSPELSIVVPAFDEAESLPHLWRELREALGDDPPWEAILVDDGSRDRTLDAMLSLAAGDPRCRVLHRPRNAGQSAALAAGFRHARGRVVVTLDADLQNDPSDIPRLVAALDTADLVSGVRVRRRDSLLRRFSSRIANLVRGGVLGDGVTDVGCSLKAYRAELLRAVPPFDGMHRFLPALVRMQGARVVELPVGHRPRRFGTSKYGINDRLWRGLFDLLGVRWLQRRWVDLEATKELHP